jgi:hypothetical protein
MFKLQRRDFIAKMALMTAGTVASSPSFASAGFSLGQPGFTTIRPQDTGAALVNPGMGWTMHFYSNIIANYGSKLEPSDTLDDFPGLSTVYLRVPWSFIELEEGKFNWELLDTPAQRFIDKGMKVAFRITSSESWLRYATPEWVKKAGAKGYDFPETKTLWEPDFADPIFLEKVDNFVKAMADRYDGNDNVAFVDVGHYGLWGEGHTLMSSKIDYPLDVLKAHIDIYCKHFKKTLLAISDDFAGHSEPGAHFPITDYAFSKGVTIRDDSILVQAPPNSWFHSEMAQLFWPTLPVILEHEHYGGSKARKAWSKELLLKAVEDYHASYLSIHWWPRELLVDNRDVIDQINQRMGYRIQLQEITYPAAVKRGEPFTVKTSWRNAGVAPCYAGGYSCFTLKDEKGGIVSTLVDERFSVSQLETGAPGKASVKHINTTFTIDPSFKDPANTFSRNVKPGEYDLYVSIGKKDGTPLLNLPYARTDAHKRVLLGKIKIE